MKMILYSSLVCYVSNLKIILIWSLSLEKKLTKLDVVNSNLFFDFDKMLFSGIIEQKENFVCKKWKPDTYVYLNFFFVKIIHRWTICILSWNACIEYFYYTRMGLWIRWLVFISVHIHKVPLLIWFINYFILSNILFYSRYCTLI